VQQNISGRLTSEKRTKDRYTIRGYLSTAAKHGHNMMDALREALLRRSWIPPNPAPPDQDTPHTPPDEHMLAGHHPRTPAEFLPTEVLADGTWIAEIYKKSVHNWSRQFVAGSHGRPSASMTRVSRNCLP
jgi:hypothetical protein